MLEGISEVGPLDQSTLHPIKCKTPWRPEEKPPTEFKIETSPRCHSGWSESVLSRAALKERNENVLKKKLFLGSPLRVVNEDSNLTEFEAVLEAKTMIMIEDTELFQDQIKT